MEGNMKTGNTMRTAKAATTLTLALSLAACDDIGSPKQTASPTVAAHDPSRHGGGSQIVAAAVPGYATIERGGAADVGGALKLEADVAGDIPRHADTYIGGVAVFGYAWADLATGRAIVAVIHPAIGR